MTKINKKRVEEFIRVDHAGERGAVKIYEGQLLALNTLVKDENLKKTIEEMKVHEKEHCKFFENEKGFITQSFFQNIVTKKAKFVSGPFTNMIFEILEKQKNKIKILVGNIVTTIPNKANYLYRPI